MSFSFEIVPKTGGLLMLNTQIALIHPFLFALGGVRVFLILILGMLAQHVNLISLKIAFLCDLLCEKVAEVRSHCVFLLYASSMRESRVKRKYLRAY